MNWKWNIENEDFLKKTVERCKEKRILLPTFSQLKHPNKIPPNIQDELKNVDIQALHPLNLFRINWRNNPTNGGIGDINYLEIPKEITGVKARIVGLVGKHFPTGAHKVGATYGCLAPYMVTGRFNPDYHKAVWPSTGNYCRGGVFNSNLLGVHSVAILPEEMSKERFNWLRERTDEVYATPGCESNVKEIYDKCHELVAQSDKYLIFNQFDQFGNSIWHYEITGYTLEKLFNQIKNENQRLSGFVSATGSAGTIAAGDYLRNISKDLKVVASEALQCPTLLNNGFGGHRIEGIGDKHVPWIHNVKNTNMVTAIDDEDCMRLLRLFNEPDGLFYMKDMGLDPEFIYQLKMIGISGIGNLISAIKTAKYYELTSDDCLFTLATDSAEMYQSRIEELLESKGPYSAIQAGMDLEKCLLSAATDNMKELNYYDQKAIHNLKYFTWVEQQAKEIEDLNQLWYDRNIWNENFNQVEQWDELIQNFNEMTGVLKNL